MSKHRTHPLRGPQSHSITLPCTHPTLEPWHFGMGWQRAPSHSSLQLSCPPYRKLQGYRGVYWNNRKHRVSNCKSKSIRQETSKSPYFPVLLIHSFKHTKIPTSQWKVVTTNHPALYRHQVAEASCRQEQHPKSPSMPQVFQSPGLYQRRESCSPWKDPTSSIQQVQQRWTQAFLPSGNSHWEPHSRAIPALHQLSRAREQGGDCAVRAGTGCAPYPLCLCLAALGCRHWSRTKWSLSFTAVRDTQSQGHPAGTWNWTQLVIHLYKSTNYEAEFTKRGSGLNCHLLAPVIVCTHLYRYLQNCPCTSMVYSSTKPCQFKSFGLNPKAPLGCSLPSALYGLYT